LRTWRQPFQRPSGLSSGFLAKAFTMASSGRMYSGKEVALHNSRESCWIIVHGACIPLFISIDKSEWLTSSCFAGKVYDVTDFLDGE
jgi:hypothetical protein